MVYNNERLHPYKVTYCSWKTTFVQPSLHPMACAITGHARYLTYVNGPSPWLLCRYHELTDYNKMMDEKAQEDDGRCKRGNGSNFM